jgi:hypothetical protein
MMDDSVKMRLDDRARQIGHCGPERRRSTTWFAKTLSGTSSRNTLDSDERRAIAIVVTMTPKKTNFTRPGRPPEIGQLKAHS